MKNKNKKIENSLRFILLPLVTVLYIYGVASLTTTATILIVYIFRRDWAIVDGITFVQVLTIGVGVIMFFPARKFRARMLEN